MSMIPIASASGTGSSGTITFDNIPSTFTHLQLRVFARTSAAYDSDGFNLRFNNDTGSNYSAHYLVGDTVNASSSNVTSQTNVYIAGRLPGSTVTANIFGNAIVDILDYTSTNKNKTTRSISGFDMNNTTAVARVAFGSGLWFATPAAITRIDVLANSGNFDANSRFQLYGITNSPATGA